MITHIIYHVPGIKVGCTANFNSRKKDYPNIPEIIEELHDKTDKEAGDIEWRWADKFGYQRGRHYAEMVSIEMRTAAAKGGVKAGSKTSETHSKEWFSAHGRKRGKLSGAKYIERTTPEERSQLARTAAFKQREVTPVDKQLEIARKGGKRSVELKVGIHARTSAQVSDDNKKGAKRVFELGLAGTQKRMKCPHCGIESSAASLGRWHFDKCKHRKLLDGESMAPLPPGYEYRSPAK